MLGTMIYGERDIRVEERPRPRVLTGTDAVVRVTAACVCGSDLWGYRGLMPLTGGPRPIGHEFVGIVDEIGDAVSTLSVGDFVISPFTTSDGTCPACLNNIHSACVNGSNYGAKDRNGEPLAGAQGEYVRVPFADGTLVRVPGDVDEALVPSLLALSDVMSTGHHAAESAGVEEGSTVVVVGDGAVGLCAVLAAHRLGAERIIAMSRHESRQKLARDFGATDIVAERGDEGIAKVHELLDGQGADCVLEAVGMKESMHQALHSARPGGSVGYVGAPVGGPELPIGYLFSNNIHVGGGVAPARAYIPELLDDVLAGTINPGLVFDLTLPLAEAPAAYAAMDERRAIKVLLKP